MNRIGTGAQRHGRMFGAVGPVAGARAGCRLRSGAC